MADSKKKNYKDLSYSELVTKRNELKKSYMDLRFQAITGHVENPMQKRTIRREIAVDASFSRKSTTSRLVNASELNNNWRCSGSQNATCSPVRCSTK